MDNEATNPLPWSRATTLTERLARLSCVSDAGRHLCFDAERAERRLRRWRSQEAFADDDALFQERLKVDALSQTQLRFVLGVPAEVLFSDQPAPAWWRRLNAAFDDAPPGTEPQARTDQASQHPAEAFRVLVEPLVRLACNRLRGTLNLDMANAEHLPFAPSTFDQLLVDDLTRRLGARVARTLVLEMHVARVRGLLRGATAAERYGSFLDRLARPEVARELFSEYPVLARQLMRALDQWVRTGCRFLCHLAADWADIQATFGDAKRWGKLTEVQTGAGDRHLGGQSVRILKFASGHRLVYKPRSLAVDRHFQELLRWTNQRGFAPHFRTLTILDRGAYGWVEFVESAACAAPDEVRRFYQRQGGYLALLYLLHATDLHYENLIAAGEQPILIDLESLFHPDLRRADSLQLNSVARQAMADSVLRIGLLPFRVWGDDDRQGVEISGLGGAEGQQTPNPVPAWDAVGTDEMRFARKRVEMPAQANRPMLGTQPADASAHVRDLAAGFARMYRLLARHRRELAAAEGPLARFARDAVRCIARPTQVYGTLLGESFHPNLLRDALDRERFFEHLWAKTTRLQRRLIEYERADLDRGDIPVFGTRPGSRRLDAGFGRVVRDLLPESGLTRARRRLRKLSKADLDRQLSFLRLSLSALALGEPVAVRRAELSATIDARREDFLAEACKIAERLETLAFRGNGEIGWIGVGVTRDRFWTLSPANFDLYAGLPGIGLFFAYLSTLTGDPGHRTLAQDVLRTVQAHLDDLRKPKRLPIGIFGPLGGLIYYLCHAASLFERPELFGDVEKLLELLPQHIENDREWDMIGGCAGCVVALTVYHRCHPSQPALDLALRCGEHLLKGAVPAGKGAAWPAADDSDGPLTGFAHGTAGIAWSLLELAALSGQDRFRTAAADATAYERGLYAADKENWPDLRRLPNRGDKIYLAAWCYGAPGIGLARLLCREHCHDEELDGEIKAAAHTTRKAVLGGNHSLCHGGLGNLDILAQLSSVLPGESGPEIRTLAGTLLEDMSTYGWECGTPSGVETPGLMLGLAGLGYGLLRLAEPTRVPSVLSLAPPIRKLK